MNKRIKKKLNNRDGYRHFNEYINENLRERICDFVKDTLGPGHIVMIKFSKNGKHIIEISVGLRGSVTEVNMNLIQQIDDIVKKGRIPWNP